MKVYSQHRCSKRHRSGQTFLRCRYRSHYGSGGGSGNFAAIDWSRVLVTATYHQTAAEAKRWQAERGGEAVEIDLG